MASLTASPVATERPPVVAAAGALLVLIAALAAPVMLLSPLGFDPAVFAIGGIFVLLKLIAAIGVWRCRRWAAILGFAATLLDTLLALPGFAEEGGGTGKALLTVGVAASIAALVLLALPSARRAYR